jgi:hypothetical protein
MRAEAGGDPRLRASFFAHVLVELLIDGALVRRDPSLPRRYLGALSRVDPGRVALMASELCHRPVAGLAALIPLFRTRAGFSELTLDPPVIDRVARTAERVGLRAPPARVLASAMGIRALVERDLERLLGPAAISDKI